ncbi:MAG: hypothetical protein L3J04_01420 [Robiginitomaculum sp.]|nr:hypothetical protein [Robiginitomaculum sp.]
MAKAPKATKKPVTKSKVKAKASVKKPAVKKAKPVEDGIHPAARPFLWLGSNWAQRSFMWFIAVLAICFVLLDLLVYRKSYFALDGTLGFYAIFGFFAFTFVVMMGWPLRKLTGRKDDYYEDGEPDD